MLEPQGNSGGGSGGPGSLNDVDADRLPTKGSGGPPGHRLGVANSTDPLATLQEALGNADATGGSHE
ncbi:hypothetical protein [Mycobacterium sp. OTB74]|uniref:hypothetical protein n=1 Tax=Mycobacterium sp. OTB74 TaxID=1853452 RepID=UPI00247408EA|nr:hypothetical protein [Mycobacterium sp. OTB74]MDH6243743.1 hypothetical protein [Mycobacterium sp. OTB74]